MASPSQTQAKTAAKPAKVQLDKSVFGVTPKNHDLLKAAYTAYLANGRENLAATKTRGQVRGGGKKPWRQKGTGRARFGSSRVPIWRGGGITFGPTGNENYSKHLNAKAKKLAVKQALSLGSQAGKIKVVDSLNGLGSKTKDAAKFINANGASGNVLFVTDKQDAAQQLAVRNLPTVKLVQATYLNVYDVLNADAIVFSHEALEAVVKWLGGSK